MSEQQIEIFESKDGQASIEVRFDGESLWLSQAQMAELFDKDSDTIGLHLKNIYQTKELEESSTTEESSVVRQEGRRKVRRTIKFYNLDAIISVGYRVNSKKGTQFRIWATQRLREYLEKGYSLNHQRLEKNASELEQALKLIQHTAHSTELSNEQGKGLVDIISRYTQSFLWLQRYDEGLLEKPPEQTGGTLLNAHEARQALTELKANLIQRGEATDLFARERDDGLSALLGNLNQTERNHDQLNHEYAGGLITNITLPPCRLGFSPTKTTTLKGRNLPTKLTGFISGIARQHANANTDKPQRRD